VQVQISGSVLSFLNSYDDLAALAEFGTPCKLVTYFIQFASKLGGLVPQQSNQFTSYSDLFWTEVVLITVDIG
jgi:hypothetical protein